MAYYLGKTHSKDTPINIDKDYYDRLSSSRNILVDTLNFEIYYGIAVENFMAHEKRVHDICINFLLYNHDIYNVFCSTQISLQTTISNYVSSFRMFLNYVEKRISHSIFIIANHKNILDQFKKITGIEYNSNKYYAFIYELRNNTVHSGNPFDHMHCNRNIIGSDITSPIESIFKVLATKNALLSNGFKGSVLNRMEDPIDIYIAMKSSMQSLSNIHTSFKEVIRDLVSSARNELDDAKHFYNRKYPGDKHEGLYICENSPEDIGSRPTISISTKWDDERIFLSQRHKHLTDFEKTFIKFT